MKYRLFNVHRNNTWDRSVGINYPFLIRNKNYNLFSQVWQSLLSYCLTFWPNIYIVWSFVTPENLNLFYLIYFYFLRTCLFNHGCLDPFIFRVFLVLLVSRCVCIFTAVDGAQAHSGSSWSLSICHWGKSNCKRGQTSQAHVFPCVLTVGITSGW